MFNTKFYYFFTCQWSSKCHLEVSKNNIAFQNEYKINPNFPTSITMTKLCIEDCNKITNVLTTSDPYPVFHVSTWNT